MIKVTVRKPNLNHAPTVFEMLISPDVIGTVKQCSFYTQGFELVPDEFGDNQQRSIPGGGKFECFGTEITLKTGESIQVTQSFAEVSEMLLPSSPRIISPNPTDN
jgi:hypothetical protein